MTNSTHLKNHRRISLTAGVLYLFTFISIPTIALYKSVKNVDYILGSGVSTEAIVGGTLEIIMALACIGTAVVLYPVLKKQNETLALGLVASRILEAAAIFMGVVFLLTIMGLQQSGAGIEYLPIAHTLSSLYDNTFLVSQSFLPVVNDALLGYLLFKSRLVPRTISIIGMAGALALLIGWVAVMFGLVEQGGSVAGLSALLVALFEFVLGIWLIVRGFNTKAVESLANKS